MDIFKFNNPTASTKMEQGEVINGLTSTMWVERYLDAGEFKFVAPVSSGMKKTLPIGCFVSHVDTPEIMIVENHEITDEEDKQPLITITGRSFETWLENRVFGSNRVFPVSEERVDFAIGADYIWNQAVSLIDRQINATELINFRDSLPYVTPVASVTGSGGAYARKIQRGEVYPYLLELLARNKLGIKTLRPGPWSLLAPGSPNTAIVIHRGINRTSEVVFSYSSGEIVNADYLWSNKEKKNAVLVSGTWVETFVASTEIEYDRRWMWVDASDIDKEFTTAPTGATLDALVTEMQQRGNEVLNKQTDIALTKAEVSKKSVTVGYRTDYNVGDLVTVSGDYNEETKMRITEFVEIEDDTGTFAYPTLSLEP